MLAAQHCVCTKSSLKNEHTTRDVHVWRGGKHKGQDFFFFNDDVGTVQEEGSALGCTWQLFAVAKSWSVAGDLLSWLKHFQKKKVISVLNRKKQYQKFMVNTQKGTFEVQGITAGATSACSVWHKQLEGKSFQLTVVKWGAVLPLKRAAQGATVQHSGTVCLLCLFRLVMMPAAVQLWAPACYSS